MVGLDGEKMSKSKGNLVFVSRLRGDQRGGRVDPMAIRLALMSEHYRADRDWTDDVLKAAEQRLVRWRQAVTRPVGPPALPVLREVRESLADDLDAPRALSVVDAWAAAAVSGQGDDPASPQTVGRTVDALLGVEL
jgi:L-cysteine:1D-myo-inositol 2-amino-2-deoxy-alpha-D-glucopyranoside ligase